MRYLIKSLFLLLFAALPFAAFAQEGATGLFKKDMPIEVTADYLSYDKETETYHARGNVVIVQDSTVLMTEEAMMNMASGIATTKGKVEVVDEGGNTLEGEDLVMNVREKTAVIARGRIFYKEDNIHITGDPIKKTGAESYEAKKITYTTCDCERDETPAWHFSATSAKITVGEFVTGWNSLFHIKGVPVLYSPFFAVPVKRDRQTGFLQPRPGFSRLRGFVFDNSFFWAISRNTDATFYLDIQSKRGLGKGVEYRYIRTRKSSGEVFFYHFREKDMDRVREFRKDVDNLSRPQSATNNRWRLDLKHSEIIGDNINVRANINLISDDEYFIDFGKSQPERSLESLESNVSVSKNWSYYSLVTQFRYFNNLLVEKDSSTLQMLPEVTFSSSEQKILGSPFYFSSLSQFMNFTRSKGVRGQRLDLQPRVSLPLNPGGYFDLTPSIGPRATFYLAKDDPTGRYADRYLYDITVDLTTTFIKVYRPELDSLQAVRHSIRPKLTYKYIPEAVQDDLPKFDAVDTVAATNSVTYSLNTILTGKIVEGGLKRYFDYLYFDISQTYDINEATRKRTSDTDRKRPFSEITAELIVRPADRIRLSGKGKYDVYNSWFNSYDASLEAADSRGDALNVSYRFVREASRYLEASARAHVIKPIDLTYLKRYSFDEGRALETTYGVEYTHQCWSAILSYTARLEEKIVYLTFSLSGLGRVAGIQGSLQPAK